MWGKKGTKNVLVKRNKNNLRKMKKQILKANKDKKKNIQVKLS